MNKLKRLSMVVFYCITILRFQYAYSQNVIELTPEIGEIMNHKSLNVPIIEMLKPDDNY